MQQLAVSDVFYDISPPWAMKVFSNSLLKLADCKSHNFILPVGQYINKCVVMT